MVRPVTLPHFCPNCGSTDRSTEPVVDEDGVPTDATAVICTGCGYCLGELPPLPAAADVEEAEKGQEQPAESEPEE